MLRVIGALVVAAGAVVCALGVLGSLQSLYGLAQAHEELAKLDQTEKGIAGGTKEDEDAARQLGRSRQQPGLLTGQNRTLLLITRAEKLQQLSGSLIALVAALVLIFVGRPARRRGIVMGAIGLVLIIAIMVTLPAQARGRELARRSSCASNLQCMSLLFKLFSNEAPHSFFPQLSPNAGQLMCWGKEIYGKPVPMDLEPMYLVCPSNTNNASAMERARTDPLSIVNDDSYVYLGYVITSEDEMEAFAEVYKERVAHGLGFDDDLKAPVGRGSMGRDTFYRFRQGVERELMKDSRDAAATARMQSEIPVMFDRVHTDPAEFSHLPAGANVLFMDGHVEFLTYPNKWPLTKRMAEIIVELDALKPQSASR